MLTIRLALLLLLLVWTLPDIVCLLRGHAAWGHYDNNSSYFLTGTDNVKGSRVRAIACTRCQRLVLLFETIPAAPATYEVPITPSAPTPDMRQGTPTVAQR